MVFSSTVFLFLFLPLVLILYYNPFFRGRTYRNILLLLTSLGFYAWGEPLFILIMLLSITINWRLGNLVSKQSQRQKAYVIIGLVYNLGLLFVFKYLVFVLDNIGLLIGRNITSFEIVLPIGISFFTFQMLSYVLDIYYGRAKAQNNILNVGLYVAMFPQLIAGPIVRYETVAEEIENRKETSADFTEGMTRFVYGLAKKTLIANYMGLISDKIFGMTGGLSVATAWLGAITYTLQIYFDFSGYSDMAIGLGRMFGFHFLENFNYPYIARSITDFWRRWHISMSTWFRDYVYIPLGGNRKGKGRGIFNLFIVWLLTGIWHGANWTFIVWGLLYFILLFIEKKTNFPQKLKGFSHVYTLFFVILAWVIFRSPNLRMASSYMMSMFGIGATSLVDEAFVLYFSNAKWIMLIGICLSTPLAGDIGTKIPNSCKGFIKAVLLLILFLVSTLVCIKATYNPFIYFNF